MHLPTTVRPAAGLDKATTTQLSITIADGVFFRKTFKISPRTDLKHLVDRFCDHLCSVCTEPTTMDFWFETTKIVRGLNARLLGMRHGDIIDIVLQKECTRVDCNLFPTRVSPNIHYLPAAPVRIYSPVSITNIEPGHPERVTMTLKEINGYELVLRVREDTPLERIMQAMAAQMCMEARMCRFFLDGKRLKHADTPESLEMQDGDLIDVCYESRGGGIEQLN